MSLEQSRRCRACRLSPTWWAVGTQTLPWAPPVREAGRWPAPPKLGTCCHAHRPHMPGPARCFVKYAGARKRVEKMDNPTETVRNTSDKTSQEKQPLFPKGKCKVREGQEATCSGCWRAHPAGTGCCGDAGSAPGRRAWGSQGDSQPQGPPGAHGGAHPARVSSLPGRPRPV